MSFATPSEKPLIDVAETPEALTEAAAALIVARAAATMARRERFSIAFSGGETPRPVYERLAAARIDWPRAHIFFGDERCVPYLDPRSNFAMARTALLDHVPIPAENIHRMLGEDPPQSAAGAYDRELRGFFAADGECRFDLVLLGLGDDGHTASLFPGLPALRETRAWVRADHVEAVGMWRITLTPPALHAAQEIVFLVAGAAKADVLARVIEGPHIPDMLPAQAIRPRNGTLRYLVDVAAAASLAR